MAKKKTKDDLLLAMDRAAPRIIRKPYERFPGETGVLREALQKSLRTMQGLHVKLLAAGGRVPGSDKLGASRRMQDLADSISAARAALGE